MDHSQAFAAGGVTGALSDTDGGLDPGSGTHLGDFTLLRRLGRGAQGEVFEARQESLGRLVALKILPPYMTFSPDRVQRFRREAEAGGRLDHPNTVGVHSVGEFEGYHYIVQELVAGGRTLADRIAEGRREAELPRDWCEKTVRLFVQVADAVQAAHEAGIIHRDIKPGNILLTKDGQPKVADFGLAMVLDDLHRSRSGELIGTPFYMSPEQAVGGRAGLDQRTDVFSLGSTLYESLTLQRPFDGETRERIVEQILLHDPRDPRKVRGSLPRDLAVICMKALEKRRERRYQTAGEFADELRRFLRHEPILARPPGLLVSGGKWLRRHPVPAGFAAAFVVVAAMAVRQHSLQVQANLAKVEAETKTRQYADAADQLNTVMNTYFPELRDPARVVVKRPQPTPAPGDPGLKDIERAIQVAAALDQLPDEQWYLWTLAGSRYRNVSMFDEADRYLTQALALARREIDNEDGQGPERVAQTAFELGLLRHWTRRWDEAEPLLAESRSIASERRGAASEELALRATTTLADVRASAGRLDEAIPLLSDVVASARARDTGQEDALLASEALGILLMNAGRLDEAAHWMLPAYEEARAVYPEAEWLEFGAEVAQLSGLRGRAARGADQSDAAQVEDDRAERLYVSVITRSEELSGVDPLQTARVKANYGSFLSQRERLAEAGPVLQEALREAELAGGPDHPVTLEARNNLATLAHREGRFEDAEAGWREIIAADRRAPPNDLRPVLVALQNLAALCYYRQRFAEAEQFAAEAVERTPVSDPTYDKRRNLLAKIQAKTVVAVDHP